MANCKLEIVNWKWKFILLLFVVCYLLFVIGSPVFAQNQTPTEPASQPSCVCDKDCEHTGLMSEVSDECACCGCCQLIDILKLARGISLIISKFVGVIALVFFIVGGIMWMFSGGNPETVKRGKQILIGSLIGILIVFFAWQIVNFVICAISKGEITQSCEIFGRPWYKFPSE